MARVQPTLNSPVLLPGIHSAALRVGTSAHTVAHKGCGQIAQAVPGVSQAHPQPPVFGTGHVLVTTEGQHGTLTECYRGMVYRVARIHSTEQSFRIDDGLADRLDLRVTLVDLEHSRAE